MPLTEVEETQQRVFRIARRGTASVAMDELPPNLAALDDEVLLEERAARDETLRPLFRRWPSLSKTEMRELRRAYAERVRLARWLGRRRRRVRA
jgi:hypothetical protein